MKKRHILRELQLPSEVVNALSKIALCECGRPARHVGLFFVMTPAGHLRQDAMLLCDECIRQVDRGVTVSPLEQ